MRERIGERLALVAEVVERQATAHDITRDAGSGLAQLMSSQRDWHLLFIEFWARAVRDQGLHDEFARERRSVRELIAQFLEARAADAEVNLPAPAEQLAVVVLALSNGIAIEHLADPDTVDPSIFGVALGLLLDSLLTPATLRTDRAHPEA
jgi:BetI-type transcriptional repressor, C-terminal